MNLKGKKSFIVLCIVLILLNWISSFFFFQLDLTEDKKYTTSKYTKALLKDSLNDKIYISVYLDGDLPSGFQNLQKSTEDLMRHFKRIAGRNIDFSFINPSESSNEENRIALFNQLVDYGLSPTSLQLKSADMQSTQIIFPGAIIHYQDTYLPVNFLTNNINLTPAENLNTSIENLEYLFTSSIQRLLIKKNEKIAFLEGHGELLEKQVYDITRSVLKDNLDLSFYYTVERFNIKTFEVDSLSKEVDIQDQLNKLLEYKAIIIAKPTKPFNKLDKYLIDQYVMYGGKLIWLLDGVSVSIDSLRETGSYISYKQDLNIDDQLFKYGVRINSDLIEDQRATQIPIITGYSANIPQQSLFNWPFYPLLSSDSKHPISKGLDAIKCEFVSSLDTIQNNIKKTILLHSSSQSRINLSPNKVSLQIIQNPPPIETYNKKNVPIAVLLEGNFESIFKNRLIPVDKSLKLKERSDDNKMIIISDGDLIANKVSANGSPLPLGYDRFIDFTFAGNKIFLINSIKYLCSNTSLVNLQSKQIKLRLLDRNKINQHRTLIQILNIIIPLLFLTLFYLLFNLRSFKK